MWVVYVWKVWFHKWAYVFYKRKENKSWATRRNDIPFLTSESVIEKRCCAFYHQRLNLSCKKFYQPKVNLFWSKWHNSCVWHDYRVILSNQKSVFTQLAALTSICCKTDLNMGGNKTRIISSLFNMFCSNAAKQVTRFCCPFCCSFTCCVWFVSGAIDLFFCCALMGSRTRKLICFVYYH